MAELTTSTETSQQIPTTNSNTTSTNTDKKTTDIKIDELSQQLSNGSKISSNDGRIQASLHVAELDQQVDESTLHNVFTVNGLCKVTNVKLVRDKFTGHSLGYAYLTFEDDNQAHAALDKFNFSKLFGRVIRLSLAKQRDFVTKHIRNPAANLYVKNLDPSVDSHELFTLFKKFGEISSVRVMEHPDGRSKQFGFVCFQEESSAQEAIKQLNNFVFHDKPLHVSVAINSGNQSPSSSPGTPRRNATYTPTQPTNFVSVGGGGGSGGGGGATLLPMYSYYTPNGPTVYFSSPTAYYATPTGEYIASSDTYGYAPVVGYATQFAPAYQFAPTTTYGYDNSLDPA